MRSQCTSGFENNGASTRASHVVLVVPAKLGRLMKAILLSNVQQTFGTMRVKINLPIWKRYLNVQVTSWDNELAFIHCSS